MVQKFWRAFIGLVLVLITFSLCSWFYIVAYFSHHTLSHSGVAGLVLPTQAPSIWNLVSPGHAGSFAAPVVVLIVQVWLTGAFYGTLIRANSGDDVSTTTGISDGMRSFWRLLLWNLLWAAVALVVLGINQALPAFAPALNILVLLLRFLFLFGDISLVAERDVRYALQSATNALFRGWLAMLPFAIVLIILTDAGRMIEQSVGGLWMFVTAVVYIVAASWILHMVVARYLFLTNWHERRMADAA